MQKGTKIALILFSAVILAVAMFVMPDSFSDDTNEMLTIAISELDEGTEEKLDLLFLISEDTGKLLNVNGMVLQNTDYLIDGSASAPPVVIGSSEQSRIIDVITEEYPETAAPWNTGYAGRCEQWVCDVYKQAELPVRGACCASRSRDDLATLEGDIPAGAMIYSGTEYRSGYICEICGRDPGHVAIYIGEDKVAGSQPEFIMSLSEYKKMYGYGGWSYSGNIYAYTIR